MTVVSESKGVTANPVPEKLPVRTTSSRRLGPSTPLLTPPPISLSGIKDKPPVQQVTSDQVRKASISANPAEVLFDLSAFSLE